MKSNSDKKDPDFDINRPEMGDTSKLSKDYYDPKIQKKIQKDKVGNTISPHMALEKIYDFWDNVRMRNFNRVFFRYQVPWNIRLKQEYNGLKLLRNNVGLNRYRNPLKWFMWSFILSWVV